MVIRKFGKNNTFVVNFYRIVYVPNKKNIHKNRYENVGINS